MVASPRTGTISASLFETELCRRLLPISGRPDPSIPDDDILRRTVGLVGEVDSVAFGAVGEVGVKGVSDGWVIGARSIIAK